MLTPDDPSTLSRRELIGLAACATIAGENGAASAVGMIDPRRFGARGIGLSYDDTFAIQAAIDHAWKGGYRMVRFAAVPAFYNVTRPLICRPGVSLTGDGTYPTLRASAPDVNLLLPGNFHPDFVSRAIYDAAELSSESLTDITLSLPGAGRRYRVGDQVLVTGRTWGRTGGFPLPHFAWLNIVKGVAKDRLSLREPIDRALPLQVTRLAETRARNGVPLFFYADATITGLRLEAVRHIMSDSAMLRVTVDRNRVRARTGIYGNTFQYVRWVGNDFIFTHAAGEQSLNSLNTVATGNRFRFLPGSSEPQSAGFYFQEYARDISLENNFIDIGSFSGGGFLISITSAQGIRVRRLNAQGISMRNLIYMGGPGDPDFPITHNEITESHFSISRCDRFVFVDGHSSSRMHGNRIANCTFVGAAAVKDGIRIQRLRGNFSMTGNRWSSEVGCFTMRQSRGLATAGNIHLKTNLPIDCRDLS